MENPRPHYFPSSFLSNQTGEKPSLLSLFFPPFSILPLFTSIKHNIGVKAPWRVSFFVWIAVWDRILTDDNLSSRRMVFVDWCITCRCNGEKVDHLLLHCDKAYQLWSLVFRSFGIFWVLPRSVADTLFGWWNWPGKHVSSIWNLAPSCLMWCLWRE